MEDGWGFGYFRDSNGRLVRKENKYGVFIGADVEIGKLTNIDKGSYRDTEIHWGTKIDSLVHVAHNAIIGPNCLVVAGTVIGGSCEIGEYSYIGMNVSIKDHVRVGNHVIVGAGSVVIRDVEDYDIVAGNPAKSIKHKVKLTPEARFQMAAY